MLDSRRESFAFIGGEQSLPPAATRGPGRGGVLCGSSLLELLLVQLVSGHLSVESARVDAGVVGGFADVAGETVQHPRQVEPLEAVHRSFERNHYELIGERFVSDG